MESLPKVSIQTTSPEFMRFLEMSPDALVLVNREGEIVLVNFLACAVFGYDVSEMVGSKVEMLLPERYRQIHPQHRNGFFRHPSVRGMGEDLDLAALRSDGKEFPVEILLRPIEIDDKTHILAIIQKVSVPKQIRKELAELSGHVGSFQEMVTQANAPLMARVESLEGRMSKIELAYQANKALLEGISETVNHVRNFTVKVKNFVFTVAGVAVTAVIVAWILQRLHLK